MLKGKSKTEINYTRDVPGPGKYTPNINAVLRKTANQYSNPKISFSISFAGKIESLVPNQDVPGPGHYEIKGTVNRSVSGIKIGNSARNDALKRYVTSSPGPAAYEIIARFARNFAPKYT